MDENVRKQQDKHQWQAPVLRRDHAEDLFGPALPRAIAMALRHPSPSLSQTEKNCLQPVAVPECVKPSSSSPRRRNGEKYFHLHLDPLDTTGDEPVILDNCSDFILSAESPVSGRTSKKFFITLSNCSRFILKNLDISNKRHAVFIHHCNDFRIEYCRITRCEGFALILYNSSCFQIRYNRFQNNLAAGIMLVGRTMHGSIQHNVCTKSHGFCNCDAGIHLCAVSAHIDHRHIPENCHEALPFDQKTCRPADILMEHNVVTGCRAQGIYLEGAMRCLIRNNIITGNNKEGICFDWGTSHCYFLENIVSDNGGRKNMTKEELHIDFIQQYPILPDGSSSMKLPGVSMDNSCGNLVANNCIIGNHGGGIKLIRSNFFNHIVDNRIIGNSLGANRFITYYYGIAILAIGPINNEFTQTKNQLLDFFPSSLNVITGNTILSHSQAFYPRLFHTHGNNVTMNTTDESYLVYAKIVLEIIGKRIVRRLARIRQWIKRAARKIVTMDDDLVKN